MPLMNYKPESLEGQVIANLMESWRKSPVKMAEIIEEGRVYSDNGKNIMAIKNAIKVYRLSKSNMLTQKIKRKANALKLLNNFTIIETSIITGLTTDTIYKYLNDQNASAIAV